MTESGPDSAERITVLGGTFTPIHNGHRALLHKAFQTASHDGPGDGHVIVGLTSTDLAEQTRSDPTHVELLGPFDERRETLDAELEEIAAAYTATYEIIELTDPGGPAATREDADALVASPESKSQRRAHQIHTPPFVTAEDGTRISSTRIRNGEMDEHGRLLDDDANATNR
jgi:pantetheine-phosphate adenylyltransferase